MAGLCCDYGLAMGVSREAEWFEVEEVDDIVEDSGGWRRKPAPPSPGSWTGWCPCTSHGVMEAFFHTTIS